MLKFKKIHITGAVALLVGMLFYNVTDKHNDLFYSTEKARAAMEFNGDWKPKKSVRTYNEDGSFNVMTLQGFDLKSIPKDTKFTDFKDKWKKASQLPDASDFYGEFANKSGDACRKWSDVVHTEHPIDIDFFLHNKYIWQCGGWAGYSVHTYYTPTDKEKRDIVLYNLFEPLDDWAIYVYMICILLITPSIWCIFWSLAGHAYRLAIKAINK